MNAAVAGGGGGDEREEEKGERKERHFVERIWSEEEEREWRDIYIGAQGAMVENRWTFLIALRPHLLRIQVLMDLVWFNFKFGVSGFWSCI